MEVNMSYYEIGRKQRENEIGLAALKNGLNIKDVAKITGLDDEKLKMLLIVAFFETTCPLNDAEEEEFQQRLQQELTSEELKKLKDLNLTNVYQGYATNEDMEEGRKQREKEIILATFKLGFTPEDVSKLTGLYKEKLSAYYDSLEDDK